MNYKNLLSTLVENRIIDSQTTEIVIPSSAKLYTIDLETRTINGPDVLSVQTEHYAETVYFVVDRYYDRMDLAQTNCVVQYTTKTGNYVYAVPFCDTTTLSGDINKKILDKLGIDMVVPYTPKIIIPWSISNSATDQAGNIKYIVRFYLIDDATTIPNSETGEYQAQFSYSLSTQPASATILKSFNTEDFTVEDQTLDLPTHYEQIIQNLSEIVDKNTVYWAEAESLPLNT